MPVEGQVLYVAYGANMSSRKLLERGVTPLEPGRPVTIPGRTISFSHRGGFATLLDPDEDSKALLRPRPSRDRRQLLEIECHGVMYSLAERDMRLLAGAETGYRRSRVEIETYEGRLLEAEAFVSQPSLVLKTAVPPTERYLSLMRRGAAEHGLSCEYQSWLDMVLPWDGASDSELRFDTPSALYANIGLACTFGMFVALSLVFLR